MAVSTIKEMHIMSNEPEIPRLSDEQRMRFGRALDALMERDRLESFIDQVREGKIAAALGEVGLGRNDASQLEIYLHSVITVPSPGMWAPPHGTVFSRLDQDTPSSGAPFSQGVSDRP